MQLKILADEGVNFNIVKQLRELDYQIYSVLEERRAANDFEVLEYAKELGAILLTEDKDFGEWVFAYHIENLGVILLRYNSDELNDIITSLSKVLSIYGDSFFGKFVVITKNKFRIREL